MPTYTILIGLFFLAFVQEDSAVVSGALLGFKGAFPYWQTFAACFLGMWVSDIGIYLMIALIVVLSGNAAALAVRRRQNLTQRRKDAKVGGELLAASKNDPG
jgi:membrane protein implicated in regulation of membrane protease activity